jgi:hypothetical protein
LNALALFMRMRRMASMRFSSCRPSLWQSSQTQSDVQRTSLRKHWQYCFRHLVRPHRHPRSLLPWPSPSLSASAWWSASGAGLNRLDWSMTRRCEAARPAARQAGGQQGPRHERTGIRAIRCARGCCVRNSAHTPTLRHLPLAAPFLRVVCLSGSPGAPQVVCLSGPGAPRGPSRHAVRASRAELTELGSLKQS